MNIYDAGVFIAAGRGDHAMWKRVKDSLAQGSHPVTSTAVLAQVWRGDPRQANLARLAQVVDTVPLTDTAARRVGKLLGRSGTSDVVDAALMIAAADGDVIYTSDPEDMAHLAMTLGLDVEIIRV